MTEHTFTVNREMIGAKSYAEGDTRLLLVADAAALVRSGALSPKGEAAEKAMAELFGNEPRERGQEIVQPVKDDAPNNKDAGNAPRNKAQGGAPANKGGAKAAANAAKLAAEKAKAPAAPAVPNVGQPDPNIGQTPAPEPTLDGNGDPVPGGDTGDAGPPVPAEQTQSPPPAVPPRTGKRR